MGQISVANNNNFNSLGMNIEEPALLIARLSSPTSLTPQVIEACGYQNQSDATLKLSKAIKLSIPKGFTNVVELRTFALSPQVAKDCALSIFELIRVTQAQIIAPYIEDLKIKLMNNEERLKKVKEMVLRADKPDQAFSANYLLARDETRFLLDEIAVLKNIVISTQNRTSRLIAPIYVSDMPVEPKNQMSLAFGVLGGLFSGLLIAFGCQMVTKLKSEIGHCNKMLGRNEHQG
jgi:hypothetical protein